MATAWSEQKEAQPFLRVSDPGPGQRRGENDSIWESIWYCFSRTAWSTESRMAW